MIHFVPGGTGVQGLLSFAQFPREIIAIRRSIRLFLLTFSALAREKVLFLDR